MRKSLQIISQGLCQTEKVYQLNIFCARLTLRTNDVIGGWIYAIQPPYTNDNYTVRRKERFLLLSEKDALNYALENGMIDMDTIREKIEMNERKRYLEEHKYEKWQGKDGKFYTYLPDEQSKSGRKLLKRTTEKSLDDAIVEFYKESEKKVYCSDVFSMWIDEKLKYGEIKKQSYDKYTNDFHRLSFFILQRIFWKIS